MVWLGLTGCIFGVYELTAGGVPGGGALDGMDDVRLTLGREGGRGIVAEKAALVTAVAVETCLTVPPPLTAATGVRTIWLVEYMGVAGLERVFLCRPTAEEMELMLPL